MKKEISTKFLDKRIVPGFVTKRSPQYFYLFRHLNGQIQEVLTTGMFLMNQFPICPVLFF
jgi:hypothetical protein